MERNKSHQFKSGRVGTKHVVNSSSCGSVANGSSIQGQAAATVLAAEREARAPVTHQERRRRSEVSEEEFERRQALVRHQSFWEWLQHTDNATHFKSKENLNFWSERPAEYAKWLKMVWVEFGCPGHGKGRGMASEPWQNQRSRSTSCTARSAHRQEKSPRQC